MKASKKLRRENRALRNALRRTDTENLALERVLNKIDSDLPPFFDIVLSGDIAREGHSPEHVFLEIEADGLSQRLGEWMTRDDGVTVIRIALPIDPAKFRAPEPIAP